HEPVALDEEGALKLAVMYRPTLASMREAIRAQLLQVQMAENGVLPQLNFGGQIGITNTAGTAKCNAPFGGPPGVQNSGNCTPTHPGAPPIFLPNSGSRLPFGGIYGDALNGLFGFAYYSYAAVLTFQMPLDNAAPRAQLAQSRIQYEQSRMQYRAQLSNAIV